VLRKVSELHTAPGATTRTVLDRAVECLDSAGVAVLSEHAGRLHLVVEAETAIATVVRVSGLVRSATGAFRHSG